MDCGSIRSSVVDWTRLQQSAADFNRAWALNAPPQLGSKNTINGAPLGSPKKPMMTPPQLLIAVHPVKLSVLRP